MGTAVGVHLTSISPPLNNTSGAAKLGGVSVPSKSGNLNNAA